MFKKLLSNLPFNPSLIGQVSFYAKRLHREEVLRRTGLVLVVLAMLVQVFAVASPAEPTLAESPNDILRGGFTTREQAVNYCRTNTQDFANILAYYKVTCEALATASTVTIKSTDHDRQLDSLGRVAQGPTITRTGKPTDEYSVTINGTQYFMKNLWAWDSGAYSSYKVLVVRNSKGDTIKIMYTCGNIITIGKYTPPPPPPPPKQPPETPDLCPKIPGKQTSKQECDVCPNVPGEQSHKSECYPCPKAKTDNAVTACLGLTKTASNQTQKIANANDTLAAGGDVIVYTLSVKNEGNQEVKAFVVEENVSDIIEYADLVDIGGGDIDVNNVIRWPKTDIAAGATLQKKITIKVKDPVPQTPAADPPSGSFDLVMANVYGDTIKIKLPPSVAKTTEVLATSLPNTGPGTTLAVAFAIITFAGYFLARSRLMAKELDIVRTDFTSTGGI
jgi:uncharacterized repeat protein (TIGR01451 family)